MVDKFRFSEIQKILKMLDFDQNILEYLIKHCIIYNIQLYQILQ